MNKLIHGQNFSGQSLADRMSAAKHSIAGQGLAKSVGKATTEEVIGPKKKHLDYLLQCTNEPNVSIPQLANLLIERTQNHNWVVVFKSLISIHNLMNYGNERFTQYLASNNCTFNLGSFLDKQGVQGYDMSTYIRRYAKYLNEKAFSYRTMAFDFCKVKRGKEDGLLRTMNTEKLLKSLPILQQQVDALLEYDVTPNELTNGVINASFMLLFKDLIRLFACYNDGIINLLEKYFDMTRKQCKEGLDIYKKFIVRMEGVSKFLKVAESVGIDKGDIPDLAKAPSSLLEALEEHLKSLESAKKSGHPAPKPAAKVTSEINTFAAAASSGVNAAVISDEEKQRIIDEESKELEKLKQINKDKTSPTGSGPAAANNPFSGDTPQKQQSIDLFGAGSPSHTAGSPANAASSRPSDDLLNLAEPAAAPNPFASGAPAQSNNPFAPAASIPSAAGSSPWGQQALEDSLDPFGPNTGEDSTAVAANLTGDLDLGMTPSQPQMQAPPSPSMGLSGLDMSKTSAPPVGGATSPAFGGPGGLRAASPVVARANSPVAMLDAAIANEMARSASPTFPSGLDMSKTSAPPQSASPAFGQTLDMTMTSAAPPPRAASPSAFDGFGDILTPANQGSAKSQSENKLIGSDLDTSLASLAGNLSINPSQQVKKTEHQWKPTNASPGNQKMTAGAGGSPAWSGTGQYNQPMGGMGMAPPMGPMSGMPGQPGAFPQPTGMMGYQQPMGMGMAPARPPMGMAPQGAGMFQQPMGTVPTNQSAASQANDPFGAL